MSKRVRWYTLVGVLLLPLVFAGGFLAATWNLDDRLHTVKAAVVNNDEAVTIDGQMVPLGRQFTAALVESEREQNFDWVIATADDAADGVKDGTYAAVVTIPKEFSAAATSYSDAATARQATISIETSKDAGIAETSLGQSVAKEAVTVLNSTLTTAYLDQIYVGFNQMGAQFTDLKTGTKQLADGASTLSSGMGAASQGTSELVVGLQQLALGGKTLNTAAVQLSTGAEALASGVEKLNAGTSALPAQAKALSDGTSQYVTGVDALITQTEKTAQDSVSMASSFSQVDALASGMSGISSGLSTYESSMKSIASNPSAVASQVASQIPSTCPAQIEATYGSAGCAGYAAGLQTGIAAGVSGGATAAVTGLNTTDPSSGESIMSGAKKLSAGATQFQQAIDKIDFPTQAEANKAKAQLEQLRTGGAQIKSGMKAFSDGMPALSSGISQLATGARQYATGMNQFSSGLNQYTTGVDQAATGSAALSTGIAQLAQGTSDLSKGTSQLATGVAQGADQIPTYSVVDRQKLADVAAEPVSDEDTLGLPTPGVAWSALVVIVALWLGAMAMYIVTPTIRKSLAMSTAPSIRVLSNAVAPGILVGIVQAGILTIVAMAFGIPQGLSLVGVLLMSSLSFIAVNFALVSLFGNVGRWISAGMVIVTAATGLTSALPPWLAALEPLSPLSPALSGVKAVMTGESVVSSLVALTGWLLLGIVGAVVAVMRSRKVPATDLLAVH